MIKFRGDIVKVIDKIRSMKSDELAEFFYSEISSSDCSDCILNALDKMQFCNEKEHCTTNISNYLESDFNDDTKEIRKEFLALSNK